MKRILLLLAFTGIATADLNAQESSRRTRKLQPRHSSFSPESTQPVRSAADQLQRQADALLKKTERPMLPKPPTQTSSQTEFLPTNGLSHQSTDPKALATNDMPAPQAQSPVMPFRPKSPNTGIRVASEGEFLPRSEQPTRMAANPADAVDGSRHPSGVAENLTIFPSKAHTNATTPMAHEGNAQANQIVDARRTLSTRIIASKEINVGQPANLTLLAENDGALMLEGVELTVELTGAARFQSAEPRPVNQTDSMATWQLPALEPGKQSTIQLNVIPTVKEPIQISTRFTVIDSNQINIAVKQPEIHLDVSSVDKAIVGKNVEHNIRIWNEGDGTASELNINLGLPEGTRLVGQEGNTVHVGAIRPGEVRELVVETNSQIPGESPMIYQLAGPGVNVEQTGNVDLIVPELYAEILGPKVNLPKREGSYAVNISNPTAIDISDTRVVLEVPAGMEVTLLSRAGEFDREKRTITWDLGTMAANAADSLQFKAMLTGDQDQLCHVVVKSRETSANRMAFETRAYIHTELKLAMKNLTGPVNVGDTAEFLVVASNTGKSSASGVQVQVEVPEWIVPLPDAAYQFDEASSRLIFNEVDVPQGMAAEFKFKGACKVAGNFVVRSVLSHSSQAKPLISDASLFVLDTQTNRVGSVVTPSTTEKKVR